jgi:hypothetical protein
MMNKGWRQPQAEGMTQILDKTAIFTWTRTGPQRKAGCRFDGIRQTFGR